VHYTFGIVFKSYKIQANTNDHPVPVVSIDESLMSSLGAFNTMSLKSSSFFWFFTTFNEQNGNMSFTLKNSYPRIKLSVNRSKQTEDSEQNLISNFNIDIDLDQKHLGSNSKLPLDIL